MAAEWRPINRQNGTFLRRIGRIPPFRFLRGGGLCLLSDKWGMEHPACSMLDPGQRVIQQGK